MKFIVIDCQGFFTDENFVLKELAICNGAGVVQWCFKAIRPYHKLARDERRQVRYLENRHHGIQYSQGSTEMGELRDILQYYLRNVSRIYVKGHIKQQFLKKMCEELLLLPLPEIVNIELLNSVPQLLPISDQTYCHYHSIPSFICSKYNCIILYNFINTFLPQ